MAEQTEVRNSWTEIAPGYDERVTPANMAIAEAALQRVGLRTGERLLDVAAGSGGLSVPAARTGAEVVATDVSPGMIERLQRRASDEGLANLEARVMDGHALELADDAFDVAASQFGVMLFPDIPRGLAEMVRVTEPGGRVLLVTMGPPSDVEFLAFFLGAVEAAVPDFPGLPMDPPPPPFQLADPEELRAALADAGLRDVQVETANHRLEFRSGPEMWAWVTSSNPIGAGLVADLSEEQTEAALQALDEKLTERSGGTGPAVLDNSVNVGIGTK